MRHATCARLTAIAALLLCFAPGAAAAQDAAADWSRIVHQRWCYPDGACSGRTGMIWDSTNAAPVYPIVMRSVGLGGDVALTFDVRADGAVDPSSVTVVRASNRAFAASAIDAIRNWRFSVEAEGRPAGAIAVEMHFIYALLIDCRGEPTTQASAWAGRNQLVIISRCTVLTPSH